MNDTTPYVIEVERLTKRYGNIVAVDDVSFAVRAGEVFGILGPNGAGKTTTLECVEGLIEPTSGRISALGMSMSRDAERIKRRIGVQLQASAYFDHLTLREILDMFALIYGSSVSPERLLDSVGLADRADTTVAKLSGGQQQRFTIAATLVNDPELVFLDEPTAGLDPQARRDLWEFVRDLKRQGRSVAITTHYMEEAEALCDRVAIMDRGRIVALDSPDGLVRSLSSPSRVTAALYGAVDAASLATLDAVSGVSEGANGAWVLRSSDPAATVSALMRWLSANDASLAALEVASANLEDVFLSVTGHQLRDSQTP